LAGACCAPKANGPAFTSMRDLPRRHLVDVLLYSAASGWNTVEREGVVGASPRPLLPIGPGNPRGRTPPPAARRFGMSGRCARCATPSCGCRWWISAPQLRRRFPRLQQHPSGQPGGPAGAGEFCSPSTFLLSVQIDAICAFASSSVCGELDVAWLRGDIVIHGRRGPLAPSKGAARW